MTFGKPGTNTIYTAGTDGIIVEWDGYTVVAKGRVSVVGEGETLYSCGWDDCVRITKGRLCTDQLKTDSQPNALAQGGSLMVVMTVDGLLLCHGHLSL